MTVVAQMMVEVIDMKMKVRALTLAFMAVEDEDDGEDDDGIGNSWGCLLQWFQLL